MEIKDSGDRSQFASGAVRDLRVGKGMPCLIPVHIWDRVQAQLGNSTTYSVDMWERLARHYEAGRLKYSDAANINIGAENWKKGIPLMFYYDSAIRHLNKFLINHTDEDHLAAAIWNVMGLAETWRRINADILPRDLDNRDINEMLTEPWRRNLYLPEETVMGYWIKSVELLNAFRWGRNDDCLITAIIYIMQIFKWEGTDKDNRDKEQFTIPYPETKIGT